MILRRSKRGVIDHMIAGARGGRSCDADHSQRPANGDDAIAPLGGRGGALLHAIGRRERDAFVQDLLDGSLRGVFERPASVVAHGEEGEGAARELLRLSGRQRDRRLVRARRGRAEHCDRVAGDAEATAEVGG